MSNEELMKPRYKVIADYPGNDYEVDYVFKFDKIHPYSGQSVEFSGQVVAPEYFDKYSHLFKPLAWYERKRCKGYAGVYKTCNR